MQGENMISVAAYAKRQGITRQAVMKRIKAGKISAIHKEDPRQPKGKWMVILLDATDATNEIVKSQGSFGGEVVKSQGKPVLRLDTIDRLDVPMKYEALVNARIAVILLKWQGLFLPKICAVLRVYFCSFACLFPENRVLQFCVSTFAVLRVC